VSADAGGCQRADPGSGSGPGGASDPKIRVILGKNAFVGAECTEEITAEHLREIVGPKTRHNRVDKGAIFD